MTGDIVSVVCLSDHMYVHVKNKFKLQRKMDSGYTLKHIQELQQTSLRIISLKISSFFVFLLLIEGSTAITFPEIRVEYRKIGSESSHDCSSQSSNLINFQLTPYI